MDDVREFRGRLTDNVKSVDLGDFGLSAHLTFVKAGVFGLCRTDPLPMSNENIFFKNENQIKTKQKNHLKVTRVHSLQTPSSSSQTEEDESAGPEAFRDADDAMAALPLATGANDGDEETSSPLAGTTGPPCGG